MAQLSFRALLSVGVAVIALHNAEEAIMAPAWLATELPQIELRFGVTLPFHPSPAQLYVALVLATVIPALWVAACRRSAHRSWGMYSLMTLYAVVLVNAFVPHIVSVFIVRAYTPGVATAVLINVPYVLYVFRRAHREDFVNLGGLAVAAAVGALLTLPLIWSLQVAARVLVS